MHLKQFAEFLGKPCNIPQRVPTICVKAHTTINVIAPATWPRAAELNMHGENPGELRTEPPDRRPEVTSRCHR